jgi:hypothetical protein
LLTALAYERIVRLTRAEQMDYWTYQDNYALVSTDGKQPYPVWHVIRQMEDVLKLGAKVVISSSTHDELKILATVGPQPAQMSVLLINPIGAGRISLSGLPPQAVFSIVQSTLETQGKPLSETLRTDRAGRGNVSIPARSVLTLLGADK